MSDLLIPRPMIFIPTHKQLITRHAKRPELVNSGLCRKCGRWYKWTVQHLEQHQKPETEQQDNYTRAMALFQEYKDKHIGHCCAEREHRIFIRDNVGAVTYE
jgi:hypothetical protein